MLPQACLERAIHPSRASGRTANRKALHERKNSNDLKTPSVRPEPVEGCREGVPQPVKDDFDSLGIRNENFLTVSIGCQYRMVINWRASRIAPSSLKTFASLGSSKTS